MSGFGLEICNLTKRFGENAVVSNFTIQLEQGQILGLLGPSGCGKTTTLRCVAGLESPSEGEILVAGHQVYGGGTNLTPESRDIAMVFQSYALWPHMTVFENIAMPIQLQKMGKSEVKNRVHEVMALVGLDGLAERLPSQLSGGQQQRVAVARSLGKRPKLLLFDEPLSNLDARLRDQVRVELRELLKRLNMTAVYVTHDQVEAMSLCDRVGIMNQGQLEQVGAPEDLYEQPATQFVATFMGNANIIAGQFRERLDSEFCLVETKEKVLLRARGLGQLNPGQPVSLVIRPEGFVLSAANQTEINRMEVVVGRQIYLGSRREWMVRLGETEMRVELGSHVALGSPGNTAILSAKSIYCIPDHN